MFFFVKSGVVVITSRHYSGVIESSCRIAGLKNKTQTYFRRTLNIEDNEHNTVGLHIQKHMLMNKKKKK